MLFLLNDHIVEIEIPEAHLHRRWRAIGCGNPHELRPQDAIEHVSHAMSEALRSGQTPNAMALQDYAALIMAKTGANSLILKPRADGSLEPRLQNVPNMVLETYQRGTARTHQRPSRMANA